MKIQFANHAVRDPLWSKDLFLDKRSVREWVAALPVMDIERTTSLLKNKLRQLNNYPMSAIKRFELMEEMAPPLAVIVPELMRHYVNDKYPLPKHSATFARMVHELLIQYLQGYHEIVEQEVEAGWMEKKAYRSVWYVSIHRVFKMLGLMIRNYQLLDQPYPKSLWKEINRLYSKALRNGWLNIGVSYCSANTVTTIEYEYIHVVLMSLLNQRHLDNKTSDEIEGSMDEWISALSIVQSWTPELGSADYICLDGKADKAPFVVTQREEGMAEDWREVCDFVMPLNRLKARLMHYVKKVDMKDGKVMLANGVSLRQETLHRLLGTWCHEYTRQHLRSNMDHEHSSSFIKGLHQVHSFMLRQHSATLKREEHEYVDVIHALKLQLGTDEVYAINIHGADIWDQAYNRPAVTRREWMRAEGRDAMELEPFKCSVLDVSDGGMRIAVEKRNIGQIALGEILGFEHDGKMDVTEVRWIDKSKCDLLLIGLRYISKAVVPATFYMHQDYQRSPALYCLVGVDSDGQPVITMPHLEQHNRRELVLEYEGNETRIVLTRQFAASGSFQSSHFCLTDDESNVVSMRHKHLALEQLLGHLSGNTRISDIHIKHAVTSRELRLVDEYGEVNHWKLI